MNDNLMEKAKALASAKAGASSSSKWLARKDFDLAVEDLVESKLSFDEWKSEIANGRLVNNKLVYLAAWLEWFNEQ
jgi:hypothetical protein